MWFSSVNGTTFAKILAKFSNFFDITKLGKKKKKQNKNPTGLWIGGFILFYFILNNLRLFSPVVE
jgi:hypothetical protein